MATPGTGGQRKSSVSTSSITGGVTVSNKITTRFPTGKLNQPQLSAQTDNAWKDVVRHEKLLIKLWNSKWDFLLRPENRPNFRRESIDERLRQEGRRLGLPQYQKLERREYDIKPSPAPFPFKSSEWIGWRGKERGNSFDFYRTRTDEGVPKRRFVQEQYGYYRHLKNLTSESSQPEFQPRASPSTPLPTTRIRHTVHPLLC